MKRTWTLVSGVAVGLLLCGVSALCHASPDAVSLDAVAPATSPAEESPKVASVSTGAAKEHPLIPVIRWAEQERPKVAAIADYTAIMQKQENINGKVQAPQVLEVKVRHQPFSVYTKFRFPMELNGQQAIYVEGKNDNKLIAHGVGFQKKFGTQRLDPTGMFAMAGQKYPITEMGVLNLIDKLLEVGYRDSKFGECDVRYTEGVKIGSKEAPRECTMIQVVHPYRRSNFTFHIARIFVDNELSLPIRYESYDWPQREGETPTLLEVYTYLNLKTNVGLTDLDFDHTNPEYAFP